jgi:hypothetical protein
VRLLQFALQPGAEEAAEQQPGDDYCCYFYFIPDSTSFRLFRGSSYSLCSGRRGASGTGSCQTCRAATGTTTLRSRSSAPALALTAEAQVHQLPCTLTHLNDDGKEVRGGAALQLQACWQRWGSPIRDLAAREGHNRQDQAAQSSCGVSLDGLWYVWGGCLLLVHCLAE